MTSIPRTARALPDLPVVTLSDASILLAREGSTDGRATLADLADLLLGPPLVACIGGSAASETLALTSSAWAPVVYPTGAAVLSQATHDDQGQITADVGAGLSAWARVSYQVHLETTGNPQVLATVYLAGSAVGVVKRARVTSSGQQIAGACIAQVDHGDTIQVALKRLSGSGNVTITSLAIQVDYIPRVDPT